ncbi:MAG: nucleoside triphosphate pyrophosphatase [Pseudohongiellaceae bacterium]
MAIPRLILASASPRRQDLLVQIGVQFDVRAQDIDETPHPDEAPETYVQRMAAGKAAVALAAFPEAVILAADTTVVCDDLVLGKPVDEADAVAMLSRLSGREHQVLTAVCVSDRRQSQQALSRSTVNFRSITSDEARRYWHSGEPRGKAGAYAIQGLGAVFVAGLQGSYSGVMGLPLFETAELLAKFKLPVWQPADTEESR